MDYFGRKYILHPRLLLSREDTKKRKLGWFGWRVGWISPHSVAAWAGGQQTQRIVRETVIRGVWHTFSLQQQHSTHTAQMPVPGGSVLPHTQTKPSRAGAVASRKVSSVLVFFVVPTVTKPNSTCTRRQTAPVNSNGRAVPLRHAAGGVVRPALLLIRGRRSRRRCAVDAVQPWQWWHLSQRFSFFQFYLTKPNSTSTRSQIVPPHSNVRAVSLKRDAGGIVRPTLLLMRGRRSGRSSVGNGTQYS